MSSLRHPPSRTARLCFYLLFPGFFLYHFLVAKQWLPGLLGGYSTAMASLLLLPLGLLFLHKVLLQRDERCAMDIAFPAFVLFYLLVLLLNMALSGRGGAASEQFGIVPQFLSLYCLARVLPVEQPRFQHWLWIFLLAMTAAIAFNADEGTFVVAALDLLLTTDYLANYQAYAFVYSVVMLLVLAPLQKRSHRLALYAFAIPTLFLNGARTEFIGVLLLVLLMEFLQSRHKLVSLTVATALVGLAYASLPLLAELYPESRTVFLFIDASDDVSANERARMLAGGLRSLVESPWIGDLGSHAPGEHIHNALSALVDLGIVGFAWYVLLIAVPALDLFVLRRRQLARPSYRLAFALIFLIALFAVTAKHFTHQLLPLALGAYAQHVVAERRRQQSSKPRAALDAALAV
jgi:O-antigen ligase